MGAERGVIRYSGQPQACFLCGGFDHYRSACKTELCSRCGVRGHRTAGCKRPIICSLCGVQGHNYRLCPEAFVNRRFPEAFERERERAERQRKQEEERDRLWQESRRPGGRAAAGAGANASTSGTGSVHQARESGRAATGGDEEVIVVKEGEPVWKVAKSSKGSGRNQKQSVTMEVEEEVRGVDVVGGALEVREDEDSGVLGEEGSGCEARQNAKARRQARRLARGEKRREGDLSFQSDRGGGEEPGGGGEASSPPRERPLQDVKKVRWARSGDSTEVGDGVVVIECSQPMECSMESDSKVERETVEKEEGDVIVQGGLLQLPYDPPLPQRERGGMRGRPSVDNGGDKGELVGSAVPRAVTSKSVPVVAEVAAPAEVSPREEAAIQKQRDQPGDEQQDEGGEKVIRRVRTSTL